MIYLAVFLGGGLGSLMRLLTGKIVNNSVSTGFPLGTLISNVLACVILGIVVLSFKQVDKSNSFWYYFAAVGLCGGYSTFSTFSLETVELAQNNMWAWVALNIIGSILIGCAILYFFLLRQ